MGVDQGKVKSIGVSNFTSEQCRRAMDKMGIKIMAYAPLGSPGSRGGKSAIPFQDPMIIQLAEKYKRTPAQVLLRYLIQLGCIVIPKSIKKTRIAENFNVYG